MRQRLLEKYGSRRSRSHSLEALKASLSPQAVPHVLRAIGWLRHEHPEVRLSHKGKALARQWLSEADYVELVHQQGLQVCSSGLAEVQMSLGSWQDISRYWLFIEGALPGAPLAVGAEALATAAAQTFEELGLIAVPRNWLQLVAQREPGPEEEG